MKKRPEVLEYQGRYLEDKEEGGEALRDDMVCGGGGGKRDGK